VTAQRAAPARFDASQQHRRSMLAKVHIAKAQLRLCDDDYVAVLIRETGRTSAADCTQSELEKVIRAFEARGFSAKARSPAKGAATRPADHPAARKARAMWISLGLLGAIDDPSERALEAFARRQLSCDKLQWANQSMVYRLIEALKAIAERHGWDQSIAGLRPVAVANVLKRRLCGALLVKLQDAGLAPADWTVARAAFEFAGVDVDLLFAGAETLDLVARSLGAVLAGKRP
jgi:phage gp16-like protein